MFISDIAIKRPVFTAMVILSLILFGWVSLMGLPKELFPKVEFPVVTVTTPLPGADPETIERTVTDPLEGAINTIAGVKKLQSTSMEGASVIMIEFYLDKNVDVAYQEVQQKVASVRAELPSDIKEPIVQKISFDAAPIMQVVISGDLKPRDLFRVADKDVRERLQRIRNVGTIRIVGGQDRKVWLWLDPVRLKQHNLTIRDVRNALQAQHVEMPGGRVEDGRQELITRVKAEYQSTEELNKLILRQSESEVIRLQDVGYTEDGLEEERSYAARDGVPCITLEIQKQSNTNTVQVADDLRNEIEKIAAEQKARGAEGVTLEISVDMSQFVKESVNQVYHHLLVGGAMAVFTVLVFLLNVRSTFISAMVLPTSIMATFMMLAVMGFTINFMTLMALQLAIGLLIDDAIVVQENIMRHVEEGKPARFAAAFATREIGLAVLATTLSVVAVFGPTAFTKGIVGQFFFPFGMTISFAVLISMFVSFTLDPMLSSRMLKKVTKHNVFFRAFEAAFEGLERVYATMLGWSIRRRWIVVLLALVFFAGSLAAGMTIQGEFAPVEDRSEFQIAMRSKLGSSVAETRDVMEKLRADVVALPEVRYTVYTIGGTSSGGAEGKVTTGTMYVRMYPKADRQSKKQRSQQELMNVLRDTLARHVGEEGGPVAVSVQIFDAVGNASGMKASQIQLDLLGPDLAALDGFSQQLMARMKADGKRYKDIDTTYEKGRPEISVFVNRERAKDRGVSPLDIAETLRSGIGGADIGKFRVGADRYDIAVRLLESGRDKPERILDLDVPSMKPGAEGVELRTVASIAPSEVPVEINRLNRQRQITILANPGKDDRNRDVVLGNAVAKINGFIAEIGLPTGVTTSWTGQTEIMEESFRNLLFTMGLSVIVVFMVLAAQFESLVHPFTIMLSLPLAFVGAILALLVFGQTLSIFTMMAFIFLLGLVTKNAILLIDYANTLRERDGLPRDEAIRRAGPVRLRPILMTTFAMIVGMLPTALGTGEGAESRQPMAIAIIGGLISSTFLTLLVVPSVYSLLDPISEWMKRSIINRGLAPETAHPGSAEESVKKKPHRTPAPPQFMEKG